MVWLVVVYWGLREGRLGVRDLGVRFWVAMGPLCLRSLGAHDLGARFSGASGPLSLQKLGACDLGVRVGLCPGGAIWGRVWRRILLPSSNTLDCPRYGLPTFACL